MLKVNKTEKLAHFNYQPSRPFLENFLRHLTSLWPRNSIQKMINILPRKEALELTSSQLFQLQVLIALIVKKKLNKTNLVSFHLFASIMIHWHICPVNIPSVWSFLHAKGFSHISNYFISTVHSTNCAGPKIKKKS